MPKKGKKQRSPKRNTIAYAICIFLLLISITGGIIWYIYYLGNIAILSMIKQQEMNSLLVAKERILQDMQSVISDLKFLAESELLPSYLAKKPNSHVVKKELKAFCQARQKYQKILFLDQQGDIIFKIGCSKTYTPDQAKKSLSSLIFQLKQNDVYISPMKLGRSGGKIIKPHIPIIQFGKPIFDKNKQKIGYVVLFYLVKESLGHLSDNHVLVNYDGFWLKGGGRDAWDYMQSKDESFAVKHKQKWTVISQKRYGQSLDFNSLLSFCLVSPFKKLESREFSLELISENSIYTWRLISDLPYHKMDIDFDERKQKFIYLFLSFAVFFAFSCIIFASQTIKRKRSDEHFKVLFKYSEDAHFLLKNGVIKDCNDSALKLLGYKSRNQLLGQNYLSLSAEKQPDGSLSSDIIKEYEDQAHNTGYSRFDFMQKKQDQTPFPVEVMITPILHEKEKTEVIVWHDLTNRKQTEMKLKELTEAVESSSAIIIIADKEGIIEYINPAFSQITGYSSREVIGKKSNILRSGQTPSNVYSDLWQTIKSGNSWTGELENKKKNGDLFWQVVSINPLKNEKGEIERFISVQEDISRQKLVEKELKNAIQKADIANQTKSEFLANVSHEIRTPMNAILGFSEILSGLIEDKQQREFLDSIRSSGKYLLVLINDILDISKVEAGKLNMEYSAFSLYHVLSDFKQIFAEKIKEKKLDLLVETDDNVPDYIVLDEVRLRQILINLVGNAIKFTDSGYIKVTTSAERLPDQPANTINITFVVEDTGVGIPEDQQDIIFEAFEQQRGPDYKHIGGTGLGLAITKRLVNMMGGDIQLKSNIGKGSRFIISINNILTASEDTFQRVIEPVFNIDSVQFEKNSVLIADDDRANRNLVKGYLTTSFPELELFEAENGLEAVDKAIAHQPGIIFMDVVMPKLSGVQAVKQIRQNERTSQTPIVALTASIKKDIAALLNKYCDGFLRKPVSKESLIKEMMRFLPHSSAEKNISTPINESKIKASVTKMEQVTDKDFDKIHEFPSFLRAYSAILDEEFEELSKDLMINELTGFSQKMLSLGHQYHVKQLIHLAQHLMDQVDAFNVEKIPQTLDEFPKLRTSLTTWQNKNPTT